MLNTVAVFGPRIEFDLLLPPMMVWIELNVPPTPVTRDEGMLMLVAVVYDERSIVFVPAPPLTLPATVAPALNLKTSLPAPAT